MSEQLFLQASSAQYTFYNPAFLTLMFQVSSYTTAHFIDMIPIPPPPPQKNAFPRKVKNFDNSDLAMNV